MRDSHTECKDRQGRRDRRGEPGTRISGTGRGRGGQRDGGRRMDRGRRRQTQRLGGGETGKRSQRRRKSRETGAIGSLLSALPSSSTLPATHLCFPCLFPCLLRISYVPSLPHGTQVSLHCGFASPGCCGVSGATLGGALGLCWERHQSPPATQGRTRNQGLPCSSPNLIFPVLSLCPLNIPQTCSHPAPPVSDIASGSFRLVGSTLLCCWHSCTQVGCLQ